MLSKHIYDILLGRSLQFSYPLENYTAGIMQVEGYDSFRLLMGCTNG